MISSDSAFYALCRDKCIKCTRLAPHHFLVSQLPPGEWDAEKTDRGIEVTLTKRETRSLKVPTWFTNFCTWAQGRGLGFKKLQGSVCHSEDFGFDGLGLHGWTLVFCPQWPDTVKLPEFAKQLDDGVYLLLKNGRQKSFKVRKEEKRRLLELIEGDILRYLTLIDAGQDKREALQDSLREWCEQMGFIYKPCNLRLDPSQTIHELLLSQKWEYKIER